MKNIILILMTLGLSLAVTAQESINYKTPEQKLNDEFCTGLFKTTDGSILDVASQPGINAYLNILDWMQGRVAGLQVFTSPNGVTIPVIRGRIPAIFVDEFQVSASYLNTLSVHDIAIVKVIKTPFLGGFSNGGGAIAIYTLPLEVEEVEDGTPAR
jgi:hypothetical protein